MLGLINLTQGRFRRPAYAACVVMAVAAGCETISPPALASASFTVSKEPSWVVPNQPVTEDPADIPGGFYYQLIDRQIRVRENTPEAFTRVVKKVTTAAGLDDVSQVRIEFEPSYQKLIFHHIQVHRGGATIDALKPREIKMIQQEEELDEHLFNGTETAVVILNDVRVGDVIDYAYSITGDNPVLGGRFADNLLLGASRPAQRLLCRLIWPKGRSLHMKTRGVDLQPEVTDNGADAAYLWRREKLPAIESEDGAPQWFEPLPVLQLSEFSDWEQVARWNLELFKVAEPLSSALESQIRSWNSELATKEQRLFAALRFVQDEIRYMGIELGSYSHRPAQPSAVFARRFGDCKDKSLLLSVMLRKLGVDAHPALVNTKAQNQIANWQPSPFSFDHCIVKGELDGRALWLDPTITHQRGGLDQISNLDYSLALVVQQGARGLEIIPAEPLTEATIFVNETFTIADSAPASFQVVTTYRGAEADSIRARIASESLSEVSREYINYYSDPFPDIESEGRPTINDDPNANILVVAENYRIPRFWKNGSRWLYPSLINAEIQKPSISRRSTPLAVHHPVFYKQTTEIRMPVERNWPDRSGSVSDEAVRFEYSCVTRKSVLTLDYSFRSLTDSVPPERVGKHLDTLDQIRNAMWFEVERLGSGNPAPTSAISAAVIGAVVLGGPIVVIIIVVVRSRATKRRNKLPGHVARKPGESPETAIEIGQDTPITAHLRKLQCACGSALFDPASPPQEEGFAFDGRRLVAVRLSCGSCSRHRDLYFRWAG